jgi:nucleolar protein 56
MGKNWEKRRSDNYSDRDRERGPFKKGPTKRERILEEMKQKMKAAYLSRDAILVYIDGMIEDLEKASNLLFERLNEWYSIYFPELRISDRTKYCKLVIAIDKEDMAGTKARVETLMGDKSEELLKQLETSTGIDLLGKDVERIKETAQKIMDLSRLKEDIEKYEEGVTKEVCPNMAEVGGSKIAAKLIAHVGGLQKLAKLPASTIQVLGAEKALFKHMKKHTKPPKHGLIFQHTAVHSAPRAVRGKIARAVATKLSIAAKIDMYGKRFIGKELKEKLDERIKAILASSGAKQANKEKTETASEIS